MNSTGNNPNSSGFGSSTSAEAALKDLDATLRLLAKLPAPTGLEDRLFAGALETPRKGRILKWPQPLYARDWVRSIAAAAIVLAVGGGGLGIYAHVQNQPARVLVAPRTIFQPGGFSSAEMIRRPQTLNGPVVKKPEPVTGAKPNAQRTTARESALPMGAHHRTSAKLQAAKAASRIAK